VNIDESSVNKESQLDVNVSLFDFEVGQVVKENMTTVSMNKGTSAREIMDTVLGVFDQNLIPLSNIIKFTTDGCSTMLGEEGGLHTLLRERMPNLPQWGGCTCHDCANLLKHAVSKLNSELTSLYSQLHSYLSSVSLHRMREYTEFCASRGLENSAIPKFFDVRFRTIVTCAEWFEKDNRCLYLWFQKLTDEVESGEHKDLTTTEQFILKHFSSNYIRVMLSNKFILDVSKPIMTIINHFEEEEPNIFNRFETLAEFLITYLGKFLINGGQEEESDLVKTRDLLLIDVKDVKLQLPDTELYLGPKVDAFIAELGLTRKSPELASWLKTVRAFYCEALTKAQKYFKPALSSKLLQDCDIFSPKTLVTTPLDLLRKKVRNVASRLSNVVKNEELPDLLDTLASLKMNKDVRELATLSTPSFFFSKLIQWKDGKYSILGRLGCAILTIHNSSSAAERDFSLQNWFVSQKQRNRTGQLKLQARLGLKTHNLNLKHKCVDCIKAKEEKQDLKNVDEESSDSDEEDESGENGAAKKTVKVPRHCHCSQFEVTDKLYSSMCDGQPSRRYKEEGAKRKSDKKIEKRIVRSRKMEDDEAARRDMKAEVARLRRAVQSNKKVQPTAQVQFSAVLW
jgi:hypothetical protein